MSAETKIHGPFSITPTWVVKAEGISRDAKYLYGLLWSYADHKTRECQVARTTLADACEIKSLRTIDAWLGELIELGAVEKVKSGGGRVSNRYRLHTGQSEILPASGAADCSAPVQPVAPQQSSQLLGTRAASCSAPVQPVAQVSEEKQENNHKETLSPTSLKSGESDSNHKTNTVPSNGHSNGHKPPAEPNRYDDTAAFDTPAIVPPPTENRPERLLASAVFAGFVQATKSPVLSGKWKNPSFHERDAIELELRPWAEPSSDGRLTPTNILTLVKFSQADEFWRDRAIHPKAFCKNLEPILRAYEHSLEPIS